MGLMDRLTGEEAGTEADGGDAGLELDDGGLDDLGDGLDGGGDLAGLDGGGDDEMFDDGGSDTQAIAELDDRVGEAENELADLSSTVTTIRQENKEIGDTVDELEEKIRKLLDIYEMVTRGINPFVDDAREMDGVDGGGTFELFDMETEPADDQESLDGDLAEAEADEFFADDLGEFEPDPSVSQAEAAAEEKLDEQNDEDDFAAKMEAVEEAHVGEDEPEHGVADEDNPEPDVADEVGDESGDGMSFDELKAEYEEGEADWATEFEAGDEDGDQDQNRDEDGDRGDNRDEDRGKNQNGDQHERGREESTDEPAEAVVDTDDSMFFEEEEPERSRSDRPEPEPSAPVAEPETARAPATPAAERPAESESDYLVTSLPSDFLTELLVLEWVSVMVGRCGVGGTTRTLGRYERVGWLAPEVRVTLETYVHRLGTRRGAEEPDAHGVEDVGVDFHADSIDFLKRLAEPGETSPERVRQQLRRL